jgi:DNA-binding transcriptional LysR family regulator
MSSLPTLRDLNKLNTFVRVAERRSFTQAARDLKTTPSVVSKHMRELEDKLGFSLLNRSPHGVALTEAGKQLFENCLQLLANLDGFVTETRNVQAGPYGSLRVLATTGYARWILAPLMPDFIRRYPQLRVDLITETLSGDPIEDGCDVIVTNTRPAAPGLVERDIGPIPHVVCASPAYFKQHGTPGEPQQLREHNCLVDSAADLRKWPFKKGGREIVVDVKGSFSSNSEAILCQAALDGVGIIKVPRYTVQEELAGGRLKSIFDDIAHSPERMRAYYSKTKFLPAKTVAFIELLQGALIPVKGS